jgi:hypothetical protein
MAGLTRLQVRDTGSSELDVIATYESPDRQVQGTIYLSRPQLADAGLWFDRALAAMTMREDYALKPEGDPIIAAFTASGTNATVGLRATTTTNGSDYGATTVSVAKQETGSSSFACHQWSGTLRSSTLHSVLSSRH